MECPVCKYPNPQGATHCGMCYEVFNRSAAQAYLHAVKRERRHTQEDQPAPAAAHKSEWVEKAATTFEKIDWTTLGRKLVSYIKRSKNWLIAAAGLALLWTLAGSLLDPGLWYHLFGRKITYAYTDKTPMPYMVGMTQDIKCWSERQGRLDTPMEAYRVEEIGNVVLVKKKTGLKNRFVAALRAREWIQVLNDTQGAASHTLPLTHPSLAEARVIFDKKGTLMDRRYKLSPRLAKALLFLTPAFSPGALRHGRTWTERVEWLDAYNDWKIDWIGTLHGTLGELEPCGRSTCVRLTYQADIRPRLWEAPSWARKATRSVRGQLSTEGTVLFDVNHHALMSNANMVKDINK